MQIPYCILKNLYSLQRVVYLRLLGPYILCCADCIEGYLTVLVSAVSS